MSACLTESTVEAAALDWVATLGYTILHGPDIAPETLAAERVSYGGVCRNALGRLLRRAIDANEPTVQRVGRVERLVDALRLSIRIGVLRADDDARMGRLCLVQPHNLAAIEREHGTLFVRGE